MPPDLNPSVLLLMALIAAPPLHAAGHQRSATATPAPADNGPSDVPVPPLVRQPARERWSAAADKHTTSAPGNRLQIR
jgi:hypothetical protein